LARLASFFDHTTKTAATTTKISRPASDEFRRVHWPHGQWGGGGTPYLRGQRGRGVIPSLRHNRVAPSPPLPHPAYRLRREFHAKYTERCWKRGGGYPLPSRTQGEGGDPLPQAQQGGGYPPTPSPLCFFLDARDPARTRKLPEKFLIKKGSGSGAWHCRNRPSLRTVTSHRCQHGCWEGGLNIKVPVRDCC
jgi:hypothetical protein